MSTWPLTTGNTACDKSVTRIAEATVALLRQTEWGGCTRDVADRRSVKGRWDTTQGSPTLPRCCACALSYDGELPVRVPITLRSGQPTTWRGPRAVLQALGVALRGSSRRSTPPPSGIGNCRAENVASVARIGRPRPVGRVKVRRTRHAQPSADAYSCSSAQIRWTPSAFAMASRSSASVPHRAAERASPVSLSSSSMAFTNA